MECSVCYEIKNNFSLRWSCGHSFCNVCTENLISNNHNCPLCRNSNLILSPYSCFDKTNILDVKAMETMGKKVDNEQIYISKWEKKRCVDLNHNLIIRQIHGVIIICKDCNIIDSFSVIT